MTLSSVELVRLLAALTSLLALSHACGLLFVRLRQPRVVGEIVGGFVLSQSLFGSIFPNAYELLFARGTPASAVLSGCYQLGLLLLMFSSGTHLRSEVNAQERKTALAIAGTGMLVPFLAALAVLTVWNPSAYLGPAQHRGAFTIVFAVAMAVTSIPVISRILLDIGLLSTSFARVLLSAAVIEDVALYVAVSVALGLVGNGGAAEFGVPGWLGLADSSTWQALYHVAASMVFFTVTQAFGPNLYQRVVRGPARWLYEASPGGWLLVYLMTVTAIAMVFGVAPMLAAFVAGMVAAPRGDDSAPERDAIHNFSAAFFIPLYFAIVGFKLDARQPFNVLFFAALLVFACAVKVAGVYVGARATRETPGAALNLGIAMNARGGPCIVLASLALDAQIINAAFYLYLILLAIITSSIAGSWLQRQLRLGAVLR